MTFIGTIFGLPVIIAAILVLADTRESFPSIDAQIKKILEPFDMLFEVGLVREKIQDELTRILFAQNTTNVEIFFQERLYHETYLRKDKSLPKKVLDAVMKEAQLLGTEQTKMEMRDEIKRHFNNGTLTDVEVEKVLLKILDILREKTKDELDKYIDDHVNKDYKDILLHFNEFFDHGILRDIVKETIEKTFKEDHKKLGKKDTTVLDDRHYANYLKQNNTFRQRVFDNVMKDPLLLGTNESKLKAKSGMKKDFKNGRLTDVEVENYLKLILETLRQKTNKEMKKYIEINCSQKN